MLRAFSPARYYHLLIASVCLCSLTAAESTAQLQDDLSAIRAVRDQVVTALNQRLAADSQAGALLDFRLEAQAVYRHRPLAFELFQRGEQLYGGAAYLESYNHGRHEIDASGLRREGDRLVGQMVVTINPDQWVPADHLPRQQTYQVEATIEGEQVRGIYSYTGHLGPDKDVLTGTAAPIASTVAIDDPETPTEATALASACFDSYLQLRAAALALRSYPASYDRCLDRNTVSVPQWSDQVDDAELMSLTARLRQLAADYDLAQAAQRDFQAGYSAPDDQRFGPFFESNPLALNDEGVCILPPETGAAGPQRWQYIEHWQITGPFPAPHRVDYIEPQLPELLPSPSALFPVATDAMSSGFVYPDWYDPGTLKGAFDAYHANSWIEKHGPLRPDTALVHSVPRAVATGRWLYQLVPPRWIAAQTKVPVYGCPGSAWFAHAQLHSPKEQSVWIEIKARDAGQLWVNGSLVWHSLANIADRKVPRYNILEIPLQAGVNELGLRIRNDDPQSGVRLLWCTRGQPRAGQHLTASEELAQQDQKEAVHFNFRGNGNGAYPAPTEGQPPIAFDLEQEIGVKWQVVMPSFSHAYPVIIGDRIITGSDPDRLYCFDKHTGEQLWMVASSVTEFIDDEQERALAQDALDKLAHRNEQAVDENLKAIEKDLRAIKLKLRDDDKLDEKAKIKLNEEADALEAQITTITGENSPGSKILSRYHAGEGGWYDFTGQSMSTPATDGTHIWTRYSTGVVACYDIDGQRQWLTNAYIGDRIASVSSPVVIGDILVVEGGPKIRMKRDGIDKEELQERVGAVGGQDIHFTVGLDAATGEELWATPVKCGIGGYGSPSGPRGMRLRLPDGSPFDIILTQRYVLRASDGAVLHDATGTDPGYTGFVIGDRLYADNVVSLFWAESPEQVGVRHLVHGAGSWGQNGHVLIDNWLCGNPDAGIRAMRKRVPWQNFLMVDATTGDLLHTIKPVLEGTAIDYPPVASCGKDVYCMDKGGRILVVRAGRPPMPLALSGLDSSTYTGPIFDGATMYLRTRRSLTCFTASDATRDLAYKRSVEQLFSERARLPLPPEQPPVTSVPPDSDYQPPANVPTCKLYERLGPADWLVAGPFPPKSDQQVLKAHGGAGDIRPTPGLAIGDQTFTTLDDSFISAHQGMHTDIYNRERFQSQSAIDLTKLTKGKGMAVFYFYTVVEVTRPRVVQYDCAGPGVRSWFGGQEVANGTALRLDIGYYPLLIRAEIGRLPPFAKSKKIVVQPYFAEIDDPLVALSEWREQVSPFRPRLEEVLERLPNTPEAFDATRYLQLLGDR